MEFRREIIMVAVLLLWVGLAPVLAGKMEGISMKAAAELRGTWHEVAARMSPEAWKKIKVFLKDRVNTTPSDKEDGLQALYEYVRVPESKGGQLGAAKMLLDTDAPEVVRELLLHANKDVVITACMQLLKNKAEEPDKEPAKKDEQAVPFLVYVLARNNYIQEGSEAATIHIILKGQLVAALLHITDLGGQVGKVDVDRKEDIGRVLTAARAWAAEKKMEPLEKQRAPKPESGTEPSPEKKDAQGTNKTES